MLTLGPWDESFSAGGLGSLFLPSFPALPLSLSFLPFFDERKPFCLQVRGDIPFLQGFLFLLF